MSRPRRWLAAPGGALVLFALFLPAGCAPDTTTVTGTVAYRGKPLPGGSVLLYCADAQIVHGVIAGDGRYTIPDVPRGKAVVTVQTQPQKPYAIKHRLNLPPAVNGPVPPAGDPAVADRVAAIPARYALPEESGLYVVVDGTTLTHDIDLKP